MEHTSIHTSLGSTTALPVVMEIFTSISLCHMQAYFCQLEILWKYMAACSDVLDKLVIILMVNMIYNNWVISFLIELSGSELILLVED